MTAQEALLKIKAMFAEAQVAAPEVAVASFADYVLADGTKVMIDNLAVGGKVVLVDEAGNQTPAPAGEHTLADGTMITVDETGTITEVAAPQEEAPEQPESEVDLMKKKVAEMEAQIEELKKAKMQSDVLLNEQSDKFSKAITELTDVVIELTKTPSVQPEAPKEKFNKHFDSKQDKISRFLNKYTTNN